MKQVRFLDPAGTIRVGEWNEDSITFAGREYTPAEIEILPPTDPGKIICVGLNYADHAEESGLEIPERPPLFLKSPNAVAGHNDTVPLLKGIDQIEYEAEIGVVIDKQCRHVEEAEAMDVVAGFTCVNDISNRDDQLDSSMGGMDLFRGKSFDNAAPIGPVVASTDEVPADATIELRLNGETRQRSSRDELIYTIPELVASITRYVTLEPGDVISTGTPAGVGQLSSGDRVEIEVEGVGTLSHHVE